MNSIIVDPFNPKIDSYLSMEENVDWKVIQREALKLQEKIPASHRASEHKTHVDAVARRKKEPYIVWVSHRQTEDIRHFNIDPKSASGLSLAEQLFSGRWRVLSLEEEQAEIERRAAAKKQEIFRNENELRAKELAVAERALSFATSLKPQPQPTKETK